MAASLRERFGVEAELIRGSGGVFEITADGQLIFSKKALNRFPEEGEIEELLSRPA